MASSSTSDTDLGALEQDKGEQKRTSNSRRLMSCFIESLVGVVEMMRG